MPDKKGTNVIAKSSLAAFLLDSYEARKREVRLSERRYYSQNEYAEKEIGLNSAQTFSRYVNGATVMSMDQAALLINYYKLAIVDHFDYDTDSTLTRAQAETLAMLAEDNDIGKAIEALAKMPLEQRKAVADVILRMAAGEEPTTNFATA